MQAKRLSGTSNHFLNECVLALAYYKEKQDVEDKINELTSVHGMLTHGAAVFRWKGEVFVHDSFAKYRVRVPAQKKAIHPSLEGQISELVSQRNRIREEEAKVSSYLLQLWLSGGTLGDFLEVLPQSLHATIRTVCKSADYTDTTPRFSPKKHEELRKMISPAIELLCIQMAQSLLI